MENRVGVRKDDVSGFCTQKMNRWTEYPDPKTSSGAIPKKMAHKPTYKEVEPSLIVRTVPTAIHRKKLGPEEVILAMQTSFEAEKSTN